MPIPTQRRNSPFPASFQSLIVVVVGLDLALS